MPTELAERLARTVTLEDGRRLGYADLGRPDGRPLLWFHGTPSSRLEAVWLDETAARTGWRLIAFDRPGHGLSSPNPDARIVGVAHDVAALADELGLDRFAVLGYSGGAPFALAAAWGLVGRVSVVGLVSPWGPPDRAGAYQGVAWSERVSDGVARRVPALTQALFAGLAWSLRWAPSTVVRLMARRLEGGEFGSSVDDPPTNEVLVPLREALRQGAAGPARDLHLIVGPWGFDPGAVGVPVRVWHGDEDPEIPLHHGRYLADVVPDGQLEVMAGGNHLALYVQADHILRTLAGIVQSGGTPGGPSGLPIPLSDGDDVRPGR